MQCAARVKEEEEEEEEEAEEEGSWNGTNMGKEWIKDRGHQTPGICFLYHLNTTSCRR
jgi:hypothetical protein